MKPNPLSSLNHFTVPVGICGYSSTFRACCYAEDASQSLNLRALALLSPVFAPARPHDRSRSSRASVVEMLQAAALPRSGGGGDRGGYAGAIERRATNPGAPAEARRPPPVSLRRLLPGGSLVSAEEALAGLRLEQRAPAGGKRPYVLLNMISTADGRATLEGRSGPLGNRADRELFHGLRRSVDAVMAGAGTMRAERYGRMIRAEASRRWRSEHGLSPEPLAVIVSARLALPPDLPLLACADARVVILTPSAATLPAQAADVKYVRASRDGSLELAQALEVLRERFDVRTLLCEGGPHLNSHLLLAGV